MNDSQKQLGPLSLIAVIIGSTIGSGIFTITADMAAAGAHTNSHRLAYMRSRHAWSYDVLLWS